MKETSYRNLRDSGIVKKLGNLEVTVLRDGSRTIPPHLGSGDQETITRALLVL